MPNINKTYNFINNSGLPLSKNAQVLMNNSPVSATVNETPTTLSVSSSIPDNTVNGDIVVRVSLIVDNGGQLCPKELIDPLTELTNTQFLSAHFRGEHRANVIESNFKFSGLTVDNIFNGCSGLTYKYAPLTGVTNWSSYTNLTLSQLQSAITSGPTPYSIRLETSGYNLGSDCGVCLTYQTQAAGGQASYGFQGISQDVVVWMNQKINISSATTTTGLTVQYSMLDANYPNNLVGSTILTLSQLNAAIAALPANTPYAFQIWAVYSGTTASGTVTLNNTAI